MLRLAQEEARHLGHGFIGTEHLLLGMLHEGEGTAAKALESLDITLTGVRTRIEEIVGPGHPPPPGEAPPFTPRAKKVLELSLREALQLGHNDIGTEHILLGLVREGEGVGAQVLATYADLVTVRQRVLQLMGANQPIKAGGTRSRWARGVRPDAPGLRTRTVGKTAERPRRYAVGRRWEVEVVVAGRRPSDFAGAYDQLDDLARRLGIDLDDSRVHLSSVETGEGPGLRLWVTHEVPHGRAAGERPEATRGEAPEVTGPPGAGPDDQDPGEDG